MADLALDASPTPIELVDDSTGNELGVNSDKSLNAIQADALKATYSATIRGLVPAATATDVFTIAGSASKVIKVRRILIQGTQTGNGVTPIQLIKRSTLDTGGTSTTQTNVPHDSNDAAATVVVKAYTANPTALGTLVGALMTDQITFNNGLASGLEDKIDFMFTPTTKTGVLRNANENIAVNFAGTSVTAGSVNITVVWTEE